MLDETATLHAAVDAYRAAATAAGVILPEAGRPDGDLPGAEICRIFGVDRLPGQLTWLRTQEWLFDRVLPDGTFMMPWTNAQELLGDLSFAIALPFGWRHQIPLFYTDHVVFTFALTGAQEGEIWRYQIDADDWNPVRAASSLAAAFTEWTKGFAAGAYAGSPPGDRLFVGYGGGDSGLLLQGLGLDPFAYPVHLSTYHHAAAIRARQLACGVDPDRAGDFELHEQLLDEMDAILASL